MIESAPEAIIVYTPEKFLFVNRFAAERLGADPKSLIGHPIMEFVKQNCRDGEEAPQDG